jgi:hypothetical protein
MQRELKSANPCVAGKLVSQPYLHYMESQSSRLHYDLAQMTAGVKLIQSLLAQPEPVHPSLVHHQNPQQVNMITPPPFESQVSEIGTLEEGSGDDESIDGKKRYATRELILEAVDSIVNKYEGQIQQAIISYNHLQARSLAKQVCTEACKSIASKIGTTSLVSN